MISITLLSDQTSDATGTEVAFPGGLLELVARGTFDGAVVKFEVSYDNGGTYDIFLADGDTEFSQTVAGTFLTYQTHIPVKIRAILSDSGSSTNVSCIGFYNPKSNKLNI